MFKEKEVEDDVQKRIYMQQHNVSGKEFESLHPQLDSFRDMVHFHVKSNNAFFSSNNRVQILVDGDEKFKKLKQSIKNAKKYIHMEYYIIRNDALGKEIVELLAKKQQKA